MDFLFIEDNLISAQGPSLGNADYSSTSMASSVLIVRGRVTCTRLLTGLEGEFF